VSSSRLLIALLLSSSVLIGITACETTEEFYYIYQMDQKVDGTGFFSSYKNVTASNLNLGNLAHGSGSYSDETLMVARKKAINNTITEEIDITTDNEIVYNESVDYAYSPRVFSFGKSFRSGAYDALGKEKICVKNYGSNVSVNTVFDSLDTLSKDVSLSLYWKDVTSEDLPLDYSMEEIGKLRFNIDAAFTGRGHIGVLEVNQSVHNVKTMIDEDYVGTYSLSKKISHDYYYIAKIEGDTWLPCCSGGWGDMMYYDQKYYGSSARGVFDCTCYKAPESIYR